MCILLLSSQPLSYLQRFILFTICNKDYSTITCTYTLSWNYIIRMISLNTISICIVISIHIITSTAFHTSPSHDRTFILSSSQRNQIRSYATPNMPSSTTSLKMIPGGCEDLSQISTSFSPIVSTSTLLSTIDADIANISNDQFGLVFAGGITVMVGGLVSVLLVGFLLENSNSYASIVADR